MSTKNLKKQSLTSNLTIAHLPELIKAVDIALLQSSKNKEKDRRKRNGHLVKDKSGYYIM